MIDPKLEAALAARHAGAKFECGLDGDSSRVTVRDDNGVVTRYVVVPLAAGAERADELDRTARIVRSGLFRSLPAGVASGASEVVTVPDGSHLLLALDLPRAGDAALDAEAARLVLVALARLHAAFAGFPARLTSGLGLLPLGQWLARNRPSPAVATPVGAGWRAFAARLPDAWAVVGPLLANPAPLVDALRECQPTIVQGNPAPAELSFGDDTVIFHDWETVTRGPGALDLGAFVAAMWPVGDLGIAGCVEAYRIEREGLGRLPSDGERWEREVALGLLAGVLRHGWAIAERSESLDEWDAVVAAGLAALD